MNDTIFPGDVVIVKSGGPSMTVTQVGNYYGTPTAWCVWFEKNKNHEGTFPAISLKKDI